MGYVKFTYALGYKVTYIANGIQNKKMLRKNTDCIANAPTVSRPGCTFLGWREDTTPSAIVIPYKPCDRNGIVLYAVWSKTITHGGTITAGAGYWGYDTNPDGSGHNWSTGAGGDCDGRCGIPNCGVSDYYVWGGSGHNDPIIDPITGLPTGRYDAKPDWHGDLSASWSKNDTTIIVG